MRLRIRILPGDSFSNGVSTPGVAGGIAFDRPARNAIHPKVLVGGDGFGVVLFHSIEGCPYTAYLSVAHCSDKNCTSFDSERTVFSYPFRFYHSPDVFADFAIGSDGFPIIAVLPSDAYRSIVGLRVIHCFALVFNTRLLDVPFPQPRVVIQVAECSALSCAGPLAFRDLFTPDVPSVTAFAATLAPSGRPLLAFTFTVFNQTNFAPLKGDVYTVECADAVCSSVSAPTLAVERLCLQRMGDVSIASLGNVTLIAYDMTEEDPPRGAGGGGGGGHVLRAAGLELLPGALLAFAIAAVDERRVEGLVADLAIDVAAASPAGPDHVGRLRAAVLREGALCLEAAPRGPTPSPPPPPASSSGIRAAACDGDAGGAGPGPAPHLQCAAWALGAFLAPPPAYGFPML
eukprot:tig00021127_g18868.t1